MDAYTHDLILEKNQIFVSTEISHRYCEIFVDDAESRFVSGELRENEIVPWLQKVVTVLETQ